MHIDANSMDTGLAFFWSPLEMTMKRSAVFYEIKATDGDASTLAVLRLPVSGSIVNHACLSLTHVICSFWAAAGLTAVSEANAGYARAFDAAADCYRFCCCTCLSVISSLLLVAHGGVGAAILVLLPRVRPVSFCCGSVPVYGICKRDGRNFCGC